METQVPFQTFAFAATQEIWNKAADCLALQNNDGLTHIKRMGTNQIQNRL